MRRAALIAAVQVAAAFASAQAAAQTVSAQTVSDRPDAVALTIYREDEATTAEFDDLADFAEGGVALITETRTLDLPAGRQRISFSGVAETIVPETAALEGLSGETVERNYDFDLLSPGALLERSVGERVRLVRTNRQTGAVDEREAIVRAAPQGVVLQTADGVEALSCSGLTERVVLERAPDGLSDKATLSAVVNVLKPGPQKVRLSYLATGFNWSADYVARLAPDGKTLDLTGWITLANGGDATFVDAPTQVVAGHLSRDEETEAPEIEPVEREQRCWPSGTTSWGGGQEFVVLTGSRVTNGFLGANQVTTVSDEYATVEEVVVTGSIIARMGELGDYKLYTLPEPTTVAARQSKQARFFEARGVPVERVYAYEVRTSYASLDDDLGTAPKSLLRLRNDEKSKLGKPLPAGVVAVMQADAAGRAVLAGEDKLKDTAVGLPFELELGRAFDIVATPTVLWDKEADRGDRDRVRFEVQVELENGKPFPVHMEVSHKLDDGETGGRVLAETRRHVLKDGRPMWALTLKPGERYTLRYTMEYDD